MGLIKFIRWLLGYVIVEISGENSSAFLNFLIKKGLGQWDIFCNSNVLTLKLPLKTYLHMPRIRKEFKHKIKIRHIGKRGLPFKIGKIRKRKSIPIGIFLFFAILIFFSRFIWCIEIVGNDKLTKAAVEEAYTELGVYIGMPSENLDSYSLRDRLPLILRDVSWCSFNLEGSRLTINITEIKETSKADKLDYSNLVASTDGIVTFIDVISGNKMIQVGDVVKKGDVIVSGAPNLPSEEFTYSKGKIFAKTVKKFEIRVSKSLTTATKTGVIKNRSVLSIFGFKIPLYSDGIHYEYEEKTSVHNLYFMNFMLPVSVTTKTFFETDKHTQSVTGDAALDFALAEFAAKLKTYSVKELLSYDYSLNETDSEFIYTFNCLLIEDIGEVSKINVVT